MSNNTRNYEAHLGLNYLKGTLELKCPTFEQLHKSILKYKPNITYWGVVGYDKLDDAQQHKLMEVLYNENI